MSGLVENKVAIVTGGASGIGRATAQLFAREGAKVTVADLSEDGGAETVRLIRDAGGDALFVRTDVTRGADIQAMVDKTLDRFGRLDAAFNNAGHPGKGTNVVTCTEDEWDLVMNVNLKSVWLCMKYEIPAMLESGGGAIVNTSSGSGLFAHPDMATYTASKHGVIGLTRSAAVDFAPHNIRVNALLPGQTWTPMMEAGFKAMNATPDHLAAKIPVKRLGRPEEQAEVVVWLCSDRSSFVVGMPLLVDGGLGARRQ